MDLVKLDLTEILKSKELRCVILPDGCLFFQYHDKWEAWSECLTRWPGKIDPKLVNQ